MISTKKDQKKKKKVDEYGALPSEARCEICNYYNPMDSKKGQCRTSDNIVIVSANHVCEEWEEKEEDW